MVFTDLGPFRGNYIEDIHRFLEFVDWVYIYIPVQCKVIGHWFIITPFVCFSICFSFMSLKWQVLIDL